MKSIKLFLRLKATRMTAIKTRSAHILNLSIIVTLKFFNNKIDEANEKVVDTQKEWNTNDVKSRRGQKKIIK